MVFAGVVGEDRGLAAVEEALSDALVALEVVEDLGPVAGSGQGAGAIGKQDGPQPADRLGVVGGGDEVVERERPTVDGGGGSCRDCAVERGEYLVGGEAVSGA